MCPQPPAAASPRGAAGSGCAPCSPVAGAARFVPSDPAFHHRAGTRRQGEALVAGVAEPQPGTAGPPAPKPPALPCSLERSWAAWEAFGYCWGLFPGKAKPPVGDGSWGCTGRRRWACPHRIGSRMVARAPAAADPTVPRRVFAHRGGAREMPSQCHHDPGTCPRRCSLGRPFLHLSSFHSPRKRLPFFHPSSTATCRDERTPTETLVLHWIPSAPCSLTTQVLTELAAFS